MTHSEYFEGTLQLRNESQELIDAVVREFERKGDVRIAKIKKVPNGVDIYVSSQRFLRPLGVRLQARFGGHLEYSNRLYSRNRLTSREVYRVSVLLRLPNFKKGDVVKFKGDEAKVIGMSKKVLIQDVKSGQKRSVSYEDIR